jgi:hypothetical protein
VLFRTEEGALEEVIKLDKNDLPRDLDPNSPLWPCKPAVTSIR